ncbi:MAG: nucleotidyltransferase [Fimbriimonadales bacterium]|nr:MAG: hypothetical protein KatS3mg018_0988 [Fimbriimonadales bacterium]
MAGETRALGDDFLAALRDLVQLLQSANRSGVLIGGIAVGLHGYPRATADIDMVMSGAGIDLAKFFEQARLAGFEPRVADPADFARRTYVLLLKHSATGIPVDISLAFTPFELEVIDSAVFVMLPTVSAPVARPEDLIIMKCVAQRPIDWADIRELYRLHANQIDLARVRYWVEQFGEALGEPDLWARVAQTLVPDAPHEHSQ